MEEIKNCPISIAETIRSRTTISSYLKATQLAFYEGLSRLVGANIYIKHENHNPTGTFKIRGGVNLMFHIKKQGIKGVTTFSTGNHGLSIATAAKWFGLEAIIVVPENNNPAKNRAIKDCGAELIEAGTTFEEASLKVNELCNQRSLYYVHPANEPHLINGVGTEFLEVFEELPDIDVMILPIGAGSEAAAAITTLRSLKKGIEIIAVQAQASSAAYLSWQKKKIVQAENNTFAGGFATGIAYETPFGIYQENLDDFVLLSEDEIYDSIGLALYYTHNLAEGAGAASIMAAYKLRDRIKGKNVVLQMSGCNASSDEIEIAINRECFLTGLPY